VLSLMGSGSPATAAAALAASGNSPGSSEPSQTTTSKDDDLASEDADLENVSRSIGVLKVANDRQFYASEGHWWTILSDIAEVKRYFLEHQKEYDEQMDKVKASKMGEPSAAVSLLFRGSTSTDRTTLLANFPPKHVVDGLMQRHFNTEGTLLHLLHGATFRRQYDRHFQNPSETPVPWLGMCYSIMSLALESYHRSGDEPPDFRGKSRDYAVKYSECAAQCLVTADFTQPLNFMLEALCFYFQAEYSRSRDAETGLWMLSGIISRLAMRMGLHRDSAPYAVMSPYRGEIRRRIWAYVRTIDIQLSFQCGLPNMIRSTDCDTALPANLYDEDFDEDTGPLPAARPLSEKTTMSFMIAHTKIICLLGRIQELSMSLKYPSFEETMKLDAELRETVAELPEFLRIRSSEHSSLDPAIQVMQRYALDLLYHKCLLLLHRKFLPAARREARYLASRKACIDSCLQMLAHQSTLQIECQPGGSFSSLAWSFTTSLTTHDCLLAAMVVCLDLYHTAQAEASGRTSGDGYKWALDNREAMYAAIERTVQIWSSLRDQSLEAYKASTVLRIMLEKLRDHQELRQQLQKNFSFTTRRDGVAPDGLVASERSAALTLGMLSSGARVDADSESSFDPKHVSAQRNIIPQPFASQRTSGPTTDGIFNWPNIMTGPNLGGFGSFGDVDMTGANIDWVSLAINYKIIDLVGILRFCRLNGTTIFRDSALPKVLEMEHQATCLTSHI